MRLIDKNSEVYIPREFVRGRFMYCVADNIDFMEETPDRKWILNLTVIVCYQEYLPENQSKITVVSM